MSSGPGFTPVTPGPRFNGVLAKPTVARREYECDECHFTIPKGTVYLYVNGFSGRRVCRGHADA